MQQGKVRYIGVSNWAAWQIARALGGCTLKGFQPIRVIQPMYSLIKRQAEVELFPLAIDAGLGVVAYNPPRRRGVDRKIRPGAGSGSRSGGGKPMYRKRYAEACMFEAAQDLKVIGSEDNK